MIMLYLLEKEFKQFFRDPGLPKMAIAFPVLMMLVFPFAVSMEIRNIDLVVVDNNRTIASSKLIETCTASGYFDLVGVSDDPDWAMQQMARNKADAILTIESDFDRSLERGEPLPVGIKVNTINGTKGSIGAGYLTSCVQRFYAEHAPGRQGSTTGAQLDVSPKYYFNTYLDYKMFMVPALIVIAITMLTGFFPALNIVSEKERGTIEQINVTPVNRGIFILCKLIPYWLVAFFVLTACLLIAWWVFDYSCAGSIGLMYFFTAGNILVTAGCHLVFHDGVHARERYLHPHRLDARLGPGHYLSESHALLCRCHARHLHQGQHPGRRVDRCRRPAGHRCRHGIVGYPELQENHLNKKQ